MKGVRKRLLAAIAAISMTISIVPSLMVTAEENTKADIQVTSTNEAVERKVVTYFPDWAYKNPQNDYFTADRIPWDKVTHINYAFATVKDNKISVSNMEAATQLEFPGQTNEFPYKGHFNVLSSYKKKYPNVKTMISVGGWAESRGFYTMCQTQEGRDTFANSVVDFLRKYNFDGVDIDYEYPCAYDDAGNPLDQEFAKPFRKDLYAQYVLMMKTVKQKLDDAEKQDGKHYLFTVAANASGWVLGGMGNPEEYLQYLDFVNLMTYDYHGSWNGYVGHNSPLYSHPDDPETRPLGYSYLSTDWAVKFYSGAIDPSKIVVGVPLYTRGWEKVTPSTYPGGMFGSSWQGKVNESEGWGAKGDYNIWHDDLADGTEEPGGSNPLWHVRNLLADKNRGFVRYWDDVSKVPYLWNEKERVWLSHEDEQSMNEKMNYIINNNLGGVMFWEVDGDFDYNPSTGQYTVGDTMHTIAKEKLDAAGPLYSSEKENSLETMKFDIQMTENFDHPYNEYKMNFINNTGKAIPKPWTVEFNMPNCFAFKTQPWGNCEITKKDMGMYTKVTVKSSAWSSDLNVGTTEMFSGTTTLKVPMGVNTMILNGKYASTVEWGEAPALTGATLSSTSQDSRDGNYTVTVNVPANSNGQIVELYEGTTKVLEQAINNSAATFKYEVKNKASGNYQYKAVIRNGNTIKTSDILSVYVGPDLGIAVPTMYPSTYKSTTGAYSISVDIPINSNGTTLEIYEGTTKIATESLTSAAKTFKYDIKDKGVGIYTYKAIIKNGGAFKTSNIVNVRVAESNNYSVYSNSVTYNKGDIVSFKGKLYEAVGYSMTGLSPDVFTNLWIDKGPVPEISVVDLAKVAVKYNIKVGEVNYDMDCDVDNNGVIDLYDLVIVAKTMN